MLRHMTPPPEVLAYIMKEMSMRLKNDAKGFAIIYAPIKNLSLVNWGKKYNKLHHLPTRNRVDVN